MFAFSQCQDFVDSGCSEELAEAFGNVLLTNPFELLEYLSEYNIRTTSRHDAHTNKSSAVAEKVD